MKNIGNPKKKLYFLNNQISDLCKKIFDSLDLTSFNYYILPGDYFHEAK